MSVSVVEREPEDDVKPAPRQESGGEGRNPRDSRPASGTSGTLLGTSGEARKLYFRSLVVLAVIVGAFNTIDVITIQHEQPGDGLLGPVVWEGSSWLTFLAFSWVGWLAFRYAPLEVRPRWRLAAHVPAAFTFSLLHVGGFLALRKFAYFLYGETYNYGDFIAQFLYEVRKDVFGYVLLMATFWTVERLSRAPAAAVAPKTAQDRQFDIRDGAKILRVKLDEVLAISSAGNYVEFVLADSRRPLMRTTLSEIESELATDGFLRTHRSWLVNASRMTALTPEGSGDYTVELGTLKVPLSRRFPEALAKLRGG